MSDSLGDEADPAPPVVPDPTTWLTTIMDGLDGLIPNLFLGKEGAKALWRLVNGGLDIPLAAAHSVAARIRGRSETWQTINKALADAAAKHAAANQELVNLTVQSWTSREFRRDKNRLAIAKKTVEHLKIAQENAPGVPAETGPSEDFMNLLDECAARASSDNVQDLFGRILAGEIRKPGAFSLRALMLISVMDQNLAEAIQTARAWVLDDVILSNRSVILGNATLNLLADVGLVRGEVVHKSFSAEGAYVTITFLTKGLVASRIIGLTDTRMSVAISALVITALGAEIFSLLPPSEDIEYVRDIGTLLDAVGDNRGRLGKVEIGDMVASGLTNLEVLWEKPQS